MIADLLIAGKTSPTFYLFYTLNNFSLQILFHIYKYLLLQIHDSTSDDEFDAAIESSSVVEDLDWMRIPSLQNASELVRAATAFYTYFENKAVIDAYLAGLNCYGTKEFWVSKPGLCNMYIYV